MTRDTANVQKDNSIQGTQQAAWWRIVVLVLLACLAGIAAYLQWGRGTRFDEEFASQTYEGLTISYLNSSNHSNISVLYLTEGEDGTGITDRQWRVLNRIANETDAEIITPDIAALDTDNMEDVYQALYDWYVPWQYGNDSRILYLMGDPNDGTLASGFTAYLTAQDAHLPDETVTTDTITSIISTKE